VLDSKRIVCLYFVSQLNIYGLRVSAFAPSINEWETMLDSIQTKVLVDMVKKPATSTYFPFGKCVCDDSYSGEFCHIRTSCGTSHRRAYDFVSISINILLDLVIAINIDHHLDHDITCKGAFHGLPAAVPSLLSSMVICIMFFQIKIFEFELVDVAVEKDIFLNDITYHDMGACATDHHEAVHHVTFFLLFAYILLIHLYSLFANVTVYRQCFVNWAVPFYFRH
jgi:hypothetical protein